MLYKYQTTLLTFAMISLLSCSKKIIVDTYSHPIINGSSATTEKVDNRVWLHFTVPHDSSDVQWEAVFEGPPPTEFAIIPTKDHTEFKWVVAKEKVNFFGKDGYKFKISRLNKTYGVLITLRPEYAASLKIFASMVP